MFALQTVPEPFLVLIDFSSSENDFLQHCTLKTLMKKLKRHFSEHSCKTETDEIKD